MNHPFRQFKFYYPVLAILISALIPAFAGASTPPAQDWEIGYNGPANVADWAFDVAVNPADNSFVVTGYETDLNSKRCLSLRKYSSSHTLIWTRSHYGSVGCTQEVGKSLAIDTNGDIVVAGRANYMASSWDWVTLKYDSNGNLLYSTVFSNPGSTDDQAYAVAIDPTDHAIVVVGTENTFPMKIIRYDSSLSTQVWHKEPGYQVAYAVGIMPNRDVMVVGTEQTGSYNWRIIRYNSTGTQVNTYNYDLAGGHESCHAIAIDPVTGEYYLAGRGGITSNVDWLVRKYTSSDTLVWSTTWSSAGAAGDDVWDIALDTCNRLTGVGYQYSGGGANSWLINEYCTATGKISWTRTFTAYASNDAEAWGIALDSTGKSIVAGFDQFSGTSKWGMRGFAAPAGPCSCPMPANLSATLTGAPATCVPGDWVTLKLKVMNTGSSSASGVTPSLAPILGGANVTLISGPLPAGPVSLAYLGIQEFTWTYSVSGNGTIKFAGGAAGTSDDPVLAVSAVSNTVSITANGVAILDCSVTANPSGVDAGETADIIVGVTNSGGVAAGAVTPSLNVSSGSGIVLSLSGPVPAGPVILLAGASQNFTWTYSTTGVGTAVFLGGAAGIDSVTSGAINCTGSTGSLVITPPPAAADLDCSVSISPSQGAIGLPLIVTAIISNIGANALINVSPVLSVLSGAELLGPTASVPAPATIASGTSHTWSWTYTPIKGGNVAFSVSVTGSDGTNSDTSTCQASGDIILAVDNDSVKIVGGIRGYINPKKGEQANILVHPSAAGAITVRIYDMSGRLVRELNSSTPGNRTESIKWDGKDSGGKNVAPGSYPIIVTGPGGLAYRDKLAVLR
jgi:hypothetical protein